MPSSEQTLRWLSRPYDFLRACAQEHGKTFTLDLGVHGQHVLFSDPEDVRAIFTASAAALHAGKGNGILAPLLGEHSLLLLEEARHLRDRRLLLPAFHAKHVARFADLVDTVARSASGTLSAGVGLHEVLQRISLGVITRVVFGDARGGAADELGETLGRFLDDPRFNLALIGRLREENAEHPAFQALQRLLARVHELVRSEIARARRSGTGEEGSIVELLLLARDEGGAGLSDEEIQDELLTMVVTGHETTATAMAWAITWLGRHPHALARLRGELSSMPSRDPLSVA